MSAEVSRDDEVIARSVQGPVTGVRIPVGERYLGIPYAAAPTGSSRWLPPSRAASWSEPLDCTTYGAICPQFTVPAGSSPLLDLAASQDRMDEDCLSLNVWTPACDDAKRPTMVWIHGGGFIGGGSSMTVADGSSFARDGIVLVSINYRLGPFGFLYLDDHFEEARSTGNLGILDQIAALTWVRDNIAGFGGDPENVTVFGQSAGAISAATLIATPASKVLFRRAILQSGAGHHNLSVEAATRVTTRVLDLLDVAPGDWAALQAVSTEALVAASTQIAQFEVPALLGDEADLLMAFAPVIDGTQRHQLPIEAVRRGAALGVDLLLGTTADEMNVAVWGLPEEIVEQIPEPDVEAFFGRMRSTEEILDHYRVVHQGRSRRQVLTSVWTDHFCTIPTLRLAEAHVSAGGSAWMYRFVWRTEIGDGLLGSCHGLDLPFVFDTLAGRERLLGDHPPENLAAVMHGAWVRFAATGSPVAAGAIWPRYSEEERAVMIFGPECAVVNDPESVIREYWDGIR